MSPPRNALAIAAALFAAGCEREPPPAPQAVPSASAAVPIDRLAKGELMPGTEEIWGLVLPRGMRIVTRFEKAIHAAGPIPPEEVANYVRKHVVVSRVELGAARTIFPHSRIKGGNPERVYQIEIGEGRRHGTILEVRDVTTPKPTEGLSDAQRLKKVGLSPSGKLLDRSKLE